MPYELGFVSVNDWTTISLSAIYTNPVVVAKPLSYNDDEPAVVRIDNVVTASFDISVQEWDYQDGTHAEETVGYLVMERGSYTLPDSTMVEARTFDTDATSSFIWIDFNQTFTQTPVVITSVSSYLESDAVTTRVRNININGFDFYMQEQELNEQTHATETISYIAWEPSSGTMGDMSFEVGKTDAVFTHDWQTIVYNETFTNPPVFLADMQTINGGDVSNLRWQNKDIYGVEVKVAEEESLDNETNHTSEAVGYMVFSN